MRTDEDGDSLLGGTTEELRAGGWGVRVQVHEDVDPKDARRVLRKIVEWVESEVGEGPLSSRPASPVPF